MTTTVREIYTSGEYLQKNPGWHLDNSAWKAQTILKMIQRNKLNPQSICDIGCGAGEILRILQDHLDNNCTFVGYDVAPQAIELAKKRENERLHFALRTKLDNDEHYDLSLLIDVIQHIEDSYGYLRDIKPRSEYKIIQVPLDISVSAVLKNRIFSFHQKHGHINFYTKDLALKFLQDCGYEVIDHFYASSYQDLSPWSHNPRKLLGKMKRAILRSPANLCSLFNQDLAVRLFGGMRLIILAR